MATVTQGVNARSFLTQTKFFSSTLGLLHMTTEQRGGRCHPSHGMDACEQYSSDGEQQDNMKKEYLRL